MPYLTKNIQDKSTLTNLTRHAFPERELEDLKELTEGYFNIAYEASFVDGTKSILKIAPHPDVTVMTYEKNMMEAEVHAMQLVAEKTNVPLPEVEFYDPSCTICNAPYFFMKKLEGNSLFSQKPVLTEEQIHSINKEAGRLNKEINQITNDYFGYPKQPALQGKNWYDTFVAIVNATIQDAKNENIDLTISVSELQSLIITDKRIFEEVKTPCLVHWDLWAGNLFIENGKLTGIIDWERWLWGDYLMEVGFRSYSQSTDFLKGYGIGTFTEDETRRILWYDLYLLMIVAQEHAYRGYETKDSYDWATKLLRETFDKLKSR